MGAERLPAGRPSSWGAICVLLIAARQVGRWAGEIAGTFRIGTFQTALLALMPSLLTILRTTHPRLKLELTHADPDAALSGLQTREFDLVVDEVFAGQPLKRSSAVDQTVLRRDPIRVAVPAADSTFAAEQLADLADADWVLEPAGSAAREWADRICNAAGFRPKAVFESPDMFVHERLVRAGHAVAFLPDLVWAATPPTIRLHELPHGGYRDIVCSVRAGTSDHPSVNAVTDALRAVCPETRDAIAANLRHGEPTRSTLK
jgi:DNA-binding transcriptional LysR family regulator